LPDSFGVIFVGETFSAYLGILNPSSSLPIKGLSVTVKLLSPTSRYDLITKTTDTDATDRETGSVVTDVPPSSSIDMIVSKSLDSIGTHTLRVSVSYGNNQILRKFYRFNVDLPLSIKSTVGRISDTECVVSCEIKNLTDGYLSVTGRSFEARPGLVASRIGNNSSVGEGDSSGGVTTATAATALPTTTQLYDTTPRMSPNSVTRDMYLIKCADPAKIAQGLAADDVLGRPVLSWNKVMGEYGRIGGTSVTVPALGGKSAVGSTVNASSEVVKNGFSTSPKVTVEAVDPPSYIDINVPTKVDFTVKNHSSKDVACSVSFVRKGMKGVYISGKSSCGTGVLTPGGVVVVSFNVLGLVAGLCTVGGVVVKDERSGVEMVQPSMFSVMVGRGGEKGGGEVVGSGVGGGVVGVEEEGEAGVFDNQ
jgi:hypothetical protein